MTMRADHRRGSAYVLVLTVSMLVTTIGLSAIAVSRIQTRASANDSDWADARLLAQSALELGLLAVDQSVAVGPAWRDTYTDRAPVADNAPMGRGAYSWYLRDAVDTDFGNNDGDPFYVVGLGKVGNTSYRLEVRLEPGEAVSEGLDCLDLGLMAYETDIHDATITAEAGLAAVGVFDIQDSNVYGNVESGDEIVGTIYHGTTTVTTPRTLPDGNVFEYYKSRGTVIDYYDLPLGFSGFRDLREVVLSPTNNPYGDENAEGIYVIDCEGGKLAIENCRIVGTIVVLDPHQHSYLAGSINWEPAYENYPALLWDGECELFLESDPLDESDVDTDGVAVNFNPPSTPYQGESDGTDASDLDQRLAADAGGQTFSDAVHDDRYPSVLRGIFYFTDELTIETEQEITIEGLLICADKFKTRNDPMITILSDDRFVNDPPPGFRLYTGSPRVVPGSLAQALD